MKTTVKVGATRKNMFSVMANSGFGELEVIKDGVRLIIPKTAIKKSDGSIKLHAKKLIDELTLENIIALEERYGIKALVA